MAVNEHIEYLLGTIGDPLGRKKWLDYKLTRPMMNLAEGDFSNKDLRDYDLSDTDLSSAIFFGADLTGADFS
ncbi:pentapeptide repeat-containing protein, partial [Candidatus Sumerlaeota bacterium]|nr:pentapeptide repeat-containing protein [Candidatus Sumerlaeota bacterium]